VSKLTSLYKNTKVPCVESGWAPMAFLDQPPPILFYGYGTRGFKEMAAFEAVLEAGMMLRRISRSGVGAVPRAAPDPIHLLAMAIRSFGQV